MVASGMGRFCWWECFRSWEERWDNLDPSTFLEERSHSSLQSAVVKVVSTGCAILLSSGSPYLTFLAEAQKSHFEGWNLLSSSMCSVPGTLSRKLHGKVPTKFPPWSSTSFWPSEEDWVLNPIRAEVNNTWIKRNSWSLRKTERCNTLCCLN